MSDFKKELEASKTLADIFEVVKAVVLKSMRKSRGGLMLGMADLGNHPQGFLGAFFTVGSNVIVMNKIRTFTRWDTWMKTRLDHIHTR